MGKINVLDFEIANLIAAGEVVERPSSVLKELIENSIDSGADSIVAEIKRGGVALIRVSDNGCGMDRDDLPVAIKRHATSKIRQREDLDSIMTLGFRGEALAAIASVSRVEILSRTAESHEGASLFLEGGAAGTVESASAPEGTSIIVRDLFFNTPARLKFMKQDKAEAAAISRVVSHLALSHPNVSFRFIRDGRDELHTPGDGKLQSAVYAALGREFALSLVPVRAFDGALGCEGFVSKPVYARGSRGMQIFFVNGRLVKSQLLTAAVEEAYANRMMKGKFPGCVVEVTLPNDMVDVNVHPAKTVVKFVNDKVVFDLVYHAVCDALDRGGAAVKAEEKTPEPKANGGSFYRTMTAEEYRAGHGGGTKSSAAPAAAKGGSSYGFVTERSIERGGKISLFDSVRRSETAAKAAGYPKVSVENILPAVERSEEKPALKAVGKTAEPTAKPAAPVVRDEEEAAKAEFAALTPQRETFAAPPAAESKPAPEREAPVETEQLSMDEAQVTLVEETAAPWRIAGEVLNTYIICEDGEKNVYLIDKHAAHERVNFDRLRAMQEPIMSQSLLVPAVVELGAAEFAAVMEQEELLREFGFACEEFGATSVVVREVPADIDGSDAAAALEELAERLAATHGADPAAARDAVLHTMACKASIKGGWTSDLSELRVLVDKVQSGEVQFCPHGRPVAVKMTKYELEKMFKRA